MKQLCLILTIAVVPNLGFSQRISDSVIFYVDNRVEVKVVLPDYTDLKSTGKVDAALEEFSRLIPQLRSRLSSDAADLVKYSVGEGVTVEPGDPKVIFQKENGELTGTGVRDRAIIHGEAFEILITAADLANVPNLSLSSCLREVAKVLPKRSRWSKSLYYDCTDSQLELLEDRNNELDFLELNVGAGAGLIKHTWVPDLSLGVGIGFNRKGGLSFPVISSNLLFDFDAEGRVQLNTFLNLSYGWNISKQTNGKEVIQAELGYLVARQGDLFGENTFKLGVNWSPVKGVFVSPRLYITDNFDTLYPGIRIGFGF